MRHGAVKVGIVVGPARCQDGTGVGFGLVGAGKIPFLFPLYFLSCFLFQFFNSN
jgi:hypothetical protein